MFDFAFSEIALIGIVALIAIGPKDLPVAIKAVAEMVKKARRMAGEFQTHVDEMVREANLSEVRDQFNDLRRMDIKGKILDAVDGDRTLRKTIADNPLDLKSADIKPAPPPIPVHDTPAIADQDFTHIPGLAGSIVDARPEHVIGDLVEASPVEAAEDAGPPAFIPPAIAAAGLPEPKQRPPAFVPPAIVAASASRSTYASPYG